MLTRGVPASVLLHAVAFAAMLLWGDLVGRPQVRTPSVISVRLVGAPAGGPTRATPAPPAPQAAPEEPAPRPDATRPPKQIPREKPREKATRPAKEKPRPGTGPRTSTATGAVKASGVPGATAAGSGTGVSAGSGGPSVSGTDSDFPFAYYIQAIESRIVANWQPRQLGFGQRALISCSVHFVVGRGGAVTGVRLVRNSGVGVYDREALRAVQSCRLPPLPPQYRGSDLGVTFDFNLEPGAQ